MKNQFPGPKSKVLLDQFNKYTSAGKKPFVIDLEKCHDSFLVTVDGQEILDFENHYASKLIAYNHPALFEPEYTKKLLLAANNKTANPDHVTPEIIEYYKLLHEIAPKCMKSGNIDIVCFNSGAEAVENGMKYCVALWYEKNKNSFLSFSEKPCFISFDKAFHGRSVYTLGITDMPHAPHVTNWYKNLSISNIQLPFPAIGETHSYDSFENECIKKLELELEKNSQKIAGIITESMQGASGHRVAKPSFFQRMMVLAKKYDVPVIFDEVQVAAGNTGSVFMCDLFDLEYPPTVVCTAKKFGCGVVYFLNPMKNSSILDSTWSGSLVDMVRFVQEMKVVREEKLIEQVPEKSKYLVKILQELQQNYGIIYNIRGAGLYQGFTVRSNELRNWITETALQKENLLLMWAGTNSIRLRPHLHLTLEDIDSMVERLGRVLDKIPAKLK
jgi:L-lysine 6-transaminase